MMFLQIIRLAFEWTKTKLKEPATPSQEAIKPYHVFLNKEVCARPLILKP